MFGPLITFEGHFLRKQKQKNFIKATTFFNVFFKYSLVSFEIIDLYTYIGDHGKMFEQFIQYNNLLFVWQI